MYRVCVYDIRGGSVPVILFRAVVRGWSKKINAAGTLTFSLPVGDMDATTANLQKYRRVKLLRLKQDGSGVYETVWYGYIEATKENLQYIDVVCKGMLDFFKKRLTSNNQAFSGQGSTEAFGLLTATNSDSDTGIVAGTGGVATAKSVTAQGRIDILHAWELLAQADGAEFEIDDSGKFNFVSTLGSDKSSSITLRYRRDGTPGSNVNLTGLGEDGQSMANRVIGTTTAGPGYTSTQNDAASQAIYGLLVETKAFHEAQDQSTLDAMTQSYLTQRANPLTDYAVEPMLAQRVFDIVSGGTKIVGIQYADIGVGDLINLDIVTENDTLQVARRVAEIDVSTDENLQEHVLYTLSKTGVFVTAAYLSDGSVQQIKRRIREIESLLS